MSADEPGTESATPAEGRTILQHLKDFKDGYTMTGGDYGAMCQLFFDNLSTLLGALFAIQDMVNFGAPPEDINNVIWSKIVPGVGLTMVAGNAYYTWQAIRLTKSWGRPYTAQPYGLNTPAAFAFVFNIMCTFFVFQCYIAPRRFLTTTKRTKVTAILTPSTTIFMYICRPRLLCQCRNSGSFGGIWISLQGSPRGQLYYWSHLYGLGVFWAYASTSCSSRGLVGSYCWYRDRLFGT
jgi:hypothetical protein